MPTAFNRFNRTRLNQSRRVTHLIKAYLHIYSSHQSHFKKEYKKEIYEINQVAFNFGRSVYMYNEFARIYFNQNKSINDHNSW